jgi:hypothetical protein
VAVPCSDFPGPLTRVRCPYVEFRTELGGIGLTLVGSPAISLRAGRLRRSDHPHAAPLDEAIMGVWGSARRSKVVYELRKGSRSPLAISDKLPQEGGAYLRDTRSDSRADS